MAQSPVPEWKIEEIEKWYADGDDLRSLASVADGLGLSRMTVRKYRDLAMQHRIEERLSHPARFQQKLIDHLDDLVHMADGAARKCADDDDSRGYAMFMNERRQSALAAAKIAGLDRIGVQISGPDGGAVEVTLGSSMLEVLVDVANEFKQELPSNLEVIEAEVVDNG
tara:strand:+ start:142 stop:645 length:504 start_codon:yes stop_codon:yes gene_type:complete